MDFAKLDVVDWFSGRVRRCTMKRMAWLLLMLVLPSSAEAWCQKGTVLEGMNERFPGNSGPDIVVRVDLNQSVQGAVDVATDVNGDGYIIIGAVNGGSGEPYGHVSQRVVVDGTYPLPFGLFGSSLTLHDPNPSDNLPTARITLAASAPDIFVMDLHGAGSGVAGWLVEGDGRQLSNTHAASNALGYMFLGNGNVLHNSTADYNIQVGIFIQGDGNVVDTTKSKSNGSHGIQVVGDGNLLSKNTVGEKGRGNAGVGILVAGTGNVVSENRVMANGSHGIEVSGGTAVSPNVIKKSIVGDRSMGNLGNGILIREDSGNGMSSPVELDQNTVRANGLNGIAIDSGVDHSLKSNISGGTAGYDNGDCEFLVASGNVNAGGNKANGLTVPGRTGDPFPTGCVGTP